MVDQVMSGSDVTGSAGELSRELRQLRVFNAVARGVASGRRKKITGVRVSRPGQANTIPKDLVRLEGKVGEIDMAK